MKLEFLTRYTFGETKRKTKREGQREHNKVFRFDNNVIKV